MGDSTRIRAQLSVLSEVIGAFAAAAVDYDRLIETVPRKLADAVGDLCSVLMLTEDGQSLRLVASYDPDPDVVTAARAAMGSAPVEVVPVQRHVMETGEPLLVPKITVDETRELTTADRARFTAAIGMHSVLLVALRANGNPLGVLNLVRHRPDRGGYDELDRDLARNLAEHAAVAIANAKMLREQHTELRRAKESAERANRELEAFSYSVAHDLRAPLRAIRGFATALVEDFGGQLERDAANYLERIRANVENMGQLIDALLGLSRLNRGALARGPVDMSLLARDIVARLRVAEPQREVEVIIGDDLNVSGDAQLLRAMLENLIGNAWKFTGKRTHGRIVFDRDEGERAAFRVEDNGAGFDMTHATKLFAPFQRLHRSTEFTGTGIGLATVQRIVHRHGGRVWAESAVDRGSIFRFTLESESEPGV